MIEINEQKLRQRKVLWHQPSRKTNSKEGLKESFILETGDNRSLSDKIMKEGCPALGINKNPIFS